MRANPLQNHLSEALDGVSEMTQGAIWAKQNKIEVEFSILLSLARLDRENSLGTFLDFLNSGSTRDLLSSWGSGSLASQQLSRISWSLAKDPSIFDHKGNDSLIGTKAPAAALFPRELKSCYVAAAIAVAATRSQLNTWRPLLLTWYLVHAYDRASQGNVSDRNLRKVARGIYSVDKLGTSYKPLFLALAEELGAAIEFATVNLSIEASAERLRRSKAFQLNESEREMLRAVVRVASYEHAKDADIPAPGFILQPVPTPAVTARYIPDLAFENDGEPAFMTVAASQVAVLRPESEDDGTTLEFSVKPSSSLAQQQSLGRSIQLLSAEQRQLLPWSWLTPNPYEAEEMLRWVEEGLDSPDHRHAIFCGLVLLGCRTGRSLKRVLELSISEELGREWCISPARQSLRRTPPERENGWAPRTPEAASWVGAYAQWQEMRLPTPIQEWIKQREKSCLPANLQGLWADISSTGCAEYFANTLGKEFPRIRSAMIGGMQSQSLYKQSADDAFVRLFTSTPNTGLPASCAYANWQSNALPEGVQTDQRGDGAVIALGSRLDPIEELLASAINKAAATLIETRKSGTPIEFHNRFVGYYVLQLLAATGARPVTDPFESVRHIDLEQKHIYIDDKASGEARQGRLVPVPVKLIDELQGEYRRHLEMLARMLAGVHPALATEISQLAAGRSSDRLPQFFFLEIRNETPVWLSVSESSLENIGIVEWPLPMNLFRQRLSKKLRQKGLNPEIIDGLMGHGETHGLSYGDYSCRVWEQDMAIARPLLQECFDALGFRPVSSWDEVPQYPSGMEAKLAMNERLFGHAARAKARSKTRRNAFRIARSRIVGYLQGRELGSLGEEQLYELSKRLLLNEKGIPTPTGHHQYDYLLLKIRQWERRHHKRIKLKRRFMREPTEHSPFNGFAIGANKRVTEMLGALRKEDLDRRTTKRGQLEAGVHAALLLALEHRISDTRLLQDVIVNRNIRCIRLDGTAYLEHGYFEKNSSLVPVRRIALSTRCAHMLSIAAIQSGRLPKLGSALPKAFLPIASLAALDATSAPKTVDELIHAVVRWVDQWNALTLQGIKAGVLSGRIPSYSETWSDLLKIRKGVRPTIQGPDIAKVQPATVEHLLSRGASVEIEADDEALESRLIGRQEAAREFFGAIRRILAGDLSASADTEPLALPSSENGVTRERMGRAVLRLIKRREKMLSTAVVLLGEWIAHLLIDKENQQRAVSIMRYLGALSPAFEQVAYDADLLNMDEEEITDLYISIMDVSRVEYKQYVDDRLVMFHRWAEYSAYALPSPDWSEVPGIPPRESISAGVVAEHEYLDALRILESSRKKSDGNHALDACFLLICGYRFGLRKSEAWGLTRGDWVSYGEQVIVLVRSNRYRSLKRPWSRRQVPLLSEMTEFERSIVNRYLAQSESVHGVRTDMAILADSQGVLPSNKQAAALANIVLKQITGHPKLSLHHLRHSFANRTALALLNCDIGWSDALGWGKDNRQKIRQLLLGTEKGQRRTTWALARLLGHMGGRTTFRSYLHFMWEWHGSSSEGRQEQNEHSNFISLDELPEHRPPNTELLVLKKPVERLLTYTTALQFLRLLSRGREVEDAAGQLELDRKQCEKLAEIVQALGSRMLLSKTTRDDRSNPHPYDFLRRINEGAWRRLLAYDPPKALQGEVPPNAPQLLLEMVGNARQLVMWNQDTFSLGRVLLTALGLANHRQECVSTNDFPEMMRALAVKEGFDPITLAKAQQIRYCARIEREEKNQKKVLKFTRKSKSETQTRPTGLLQLDKAHVVPTPAQRCVVILREDGVSTIRNSLELVVALLSAIWMSNRSV